MTPFFSLLVLLVCFGGGNASHGFMVGPWLASSGVTPEEADWLIRGMSVLGIVLGLAVGTTMLMRNVRDLREPKTPPVPVPQPLVVTMREQFIEREELRIMLGSYATTDELHAMERRLEDRLQANFRTLQEQLGRSNTAMHDHITGAANKLAEGLSEAAKHDEDRIVAVHNRVNAVAENLGVVRGELKAVAETLSTLNEAITRRAMNQHQ